MTTTKLFNSKNIKRLAFVYFVGLAATNLILTWNNVGFKWLDLTTMVIALLPFAINRKVPYILFGLFGSFISAYLLFAFLFYTLNSSKPTFTTEVFMGFSLVLTTLFFSLGLMYVGMQSNEKGRFSIV